MAYLLVGGPGWTGCIRYIKCQMASILWVEGYVSAVFETDHLKNSKQIIYYEAIIFKLGYMQLGVT